MVPLHPGCGGDDNDVDFENGDDYCDSDDINTMITLVFTLKLMVIMTVMTVILHLAMEEEEFKEGRTVMVVITGGVKVNIPATW